MKRFLHFLALSLTMLSVVSTGFFYVKLRERNQLIDGLIDDVVTSKHLKDREQIVISLAQEIYRRTDYRIDKKDVDWFTRAIAGSFFNMSTAGGLKYGAYAVAGGPGGSCGTMSRILLNALWRLEIPARKLQLVKDDLGRSGAHTMIEFYHHGEWRVCSPSDNGFVWRTKDGEIATVGQIQHDPTIFSQIYAIQPDYPNRFDHTLNIRWGKWPNWLVSGIRFVIGEKRFQSMETPRLYDQPRLFLLYGSLWASALFSFLAFISRPKRPAGPSDLSVLGGRPLPQS